MPAVAEESRPLMMSRIRNQNQSEKSDPDLHQSEKSDPDLKMMDLQNCKELHGHI
jgi:hypothetical protein